MLIQHNEQKTAECKQRTKRKAKTGALLPGDDFAARVDWFDTLLLGGIGWRRAGAKGEKTYLTRPGKQAGVSATLNYSGKDNLYIFTTNANPFEPKKSYSKFAAYALLKHGGDFTAAARALAAAGYGTQKVSIP
jgi:putative DNA primase/helicase